MSDNKNLAPVLMVIYTLGYTLNIFFNKYLTHHLDAATYGDLSIGLNALEIATTIILLGTEIAVIRFLPLLEGSGRSEAFIGWNLRLLAKTFAYFLLFASISVILYHLLDLASQELHMSIYMLFAAPFSALYALLLSYLNSKNDVLLVSIIDSVLRYVVIWGAFALLLYVVPIEADSLFIGGLYVCVFFALSLFVLVLYNKRYVAIKLLAVFTSKPNNTDDEDREWKRASVSYVTSSIIFLLFLYLDKLILELVHPSEEVVGHYSLLVVLVGLFALASRSSAAVLAPNISKLLSSKETIPRLQNLIDKTNVTSFGFFALLFLFYVFFGKEILGYFGKNGEYVAVYSALIYLSMSQILLEIGKAALRLLLYGGFTVYINKVFVVCIVSLVALGVPMTYFFGLNGIIVAHIITSFLYMVAYVWKVKKEFAQLKALSFY